MKHYTIEFSDRALHDLTELSQYISHQLKEPKTARKLRNTLEQEIQTLTTLPARCPVVSGGSYALVGVRRLLVENYSVFYRIKEDRSTVYILRILYSRREWRHLLDETLS